MDKLNEEAKAKSPKKKQEKTDKKRRTLETFCTNLTRRAKDGKIDRIIGRDKEIGRVIQILSRRTKNNPCLIGEPGVGKTAIAEGIALKLAKRGRSVQAPGQGALPARSYRACSGGRSSEVSLRAA